MFRLNISSQSH